ncbi:hypothetical protein [Mycolicibacterium sp.]|uniref:hypothetical protein n=1 Tax=Mycolicibacterium sp. TaxID=2320850 RepID=UPI0025E8C643|nr:hypothetical protein [Mycolicibacterium sp.]
MYDDLGVEVMTTTTVVVEGCRHRPLRADETPEWITNVATQVWKTTAPPVAAAIAAKSTGQLSVGGQTYQIIGGSQPFTDLGADPFKVTILSQIQTA